MVKTSSYTHPLDALNSAEIQACSSACASYAADHELDNLRFNVVSLKVHKEYRVWHLQKP